jgi:hypothetical protein
MKIAKWQMRALERMVQSCPSAYSLLSCMRSGSSLEENPAVARKAWTISERPKSVYRYAPHNDASVSDGPHIRRWSLKIVI